jgi:hypothetical protein
MAPDGTGTPVRPAFSWATVPQWLIVRKTTSFTPEEIRLIASAPLVVLEKENGHLDAGSVEEGVLRAARAIKAENPEAVTLFYWNAVINYGNYRANEVFLRNLDSWALRREGHVFLFKDRYPIYNLVDPGWQDWWIDTAKGVASDPSIDGIMIDAICKTDGPEGGERALYPDASYRRAYVETATRLKSGIGNKLLLGNAIRAAKPRSNLDHLDYLDGSYVERWAVPVGGRDFAEYVIEGMAAMSNALSGGKLVLFNSGPDVFGDEQPPSESAARERWMQERIRFPLAVFLTIAEKGAFFHWGTGPDVLPGSRTDVWRNDIYPELSRPLGRPLAPAVREGNVFTRSFEHLDVRLNVETREAMLSWK